MQRLSFDSQIIYSSNITDDIDKLLLNYNPEKVFTLVDENTEKYCLPLIPSLHKTQIIKSLSGEENKNIESVINIWEYFIENGADRKSILINLGGGLLCDVGGFAASTFKRGFEFINIPTTLLAQVDASIGGKTGINFNKLKNEIGIINPPSKIFISPTFFNSLDSKNILSGYAEMIKHALLDSEDHFNTLQNFEFNKATYHQIQEIISRSVEFKNNIVVQDPLEKNIRKSLNFGHTIGHAFESFAQRRNLQLLHGEAVALGLIPELYLSHMKLGLNIEQLKKIQQFILSKYQKFFIKTTDIDELVELMMHDKKNENNKIIFTLLKDMGAFEVNLSCKKEEIKEALVHYINC